MVATAVLDQAALEALYALLERPMFNVALRRLWNAEESADVVQEAFLRLWDARGRVRLEGAERFAWRTMLNLAANRRRSARLWAWLSFDADRDTREAPGPEEATRDANREVALRQAVESLPEKLREVVLLCTYAELTQAEVAEILDLPPGTVASRRHLAAERLRAMLEGQ